MSLELVNTLATFGTFVVIAATAMAALVQLRHARSSNQIAAVNELRELQETPEFQAAFNFVISELPSRAQDPAFRYQYVKRSAKTDENISEFLKVRTVGNYFENMGLLVKSRLIDRELAAEMSANLVTGAWEKLLPLTAVARRDVGLGLWDNFEYLTVIAQDWMAAHPNGNYPARVRRIEVKDEWLEADKQYAASLAPA
jgi:hypothetical protein